jgi:hypothetical protein
MRRPAGAGRACAQELLRKSSHGRHARRPARPSGAQAKPSAYSTVRRQDAGRRTWLRSRAPPAPELPHLELALGEIYVQVGRQVASRPVGTVARSGGLGPGHGHRRPRPARRRLQRLQRGLPCSARAILRDQPGALLRVAPSRVVLGGRADALGLRTDSSRGGIVAAVLGSGTGRLVQAHSYAAGLCRVDG